MKYWMSWKWQLLDSCMLLKAVKMALANPCSRPAQHDKMRHHLDNRDSSCESTSPRVSAILPSDEKPKPLAVVLPDPGLPHIAAELSNRNAHPSDSDHYTEDPVPPQSPPLPPVPLARLDEEVEVETGDFAVEDDYLLPNANDGSYLLLTLESWAVQVVVLRQAHSDVGPELTLPRLWTISYRIGRAIKRLWLIFSGLRNSLQIVCRTWRWLPSEKAAYTRTSVIRRQSSLKTLRDLKLFAWKQRKGPREASWTLKSFGTHAWRTPILALKTSFTCKPR